MKRIFLLFLSFTFIQQFCFTQVSTQGTRFWTSFMANMSYVPIEITLVISAKNACSGTIENPNTGWVHAFNVPANGIVQIQIPHHEGLLTATENDIITKKGLLVTSTDTISLYASNFAEASFDVTNVLTEESLADEYMLQSYPTDILGSEFLIVATEDATTVDITPTANTSNYYNLLFGHKKIYPANITYSIILNKGETYQVFCDVVDGDLSGTIVKAHNKKKIAVFNGNPCAYLPAGFFAADHLVEQSMPLNTWGKKFAITSTLGMNKDRVRVTASEDDTDIYRNGILLSTIDKGKTYEFELTSAQGSCFLETSNPCAVFLYLVSAMYNNPYGVPGSNYGDPSMVLIAPIEQQIEEVTFASFNTVRTNDHKINIVANTADIASITLDGINISSQFASLAGNSSLSYARLAVTAGAHTLKSNSGFTAHAYGLGMQESYAYSLGSNVKILTPPPCTTIQTNLYDTVLVNQVYTKNGFTLPVQIASGNFAHTLPLSSVFGCDSIVTLHLHVKKSCEVRLPSIIVPGSKANNLFGMYSVGSNLPLTDCLGDYTITILNRYGQKIITVGTDGWNGEANGKMVDAGVYYYVLEYTSGNDKKQLKGSVEVIKR